MASKYELAQAYVQILPTTKNIGANLKKELNGTLDEAGTEGGKRFSDKFTSFIGKNAKAIGAAIGTALASAVTMAVALGKEVLNAYGEFQQLEGGVKKLFGEDDYQRVIANAQNAFQTVQMSANDYMQTVTSFSAALISSMGDDTGAAVDRADMALRDMADNANTFGTDMEAIQNAYQGFAKANYTMLDNLKLGYGGTKTEMERLIADANKVKAAHGEMANLSIDSFADVVEAIHTMQEEMGIAGTSSIEAGTTVEGSINMMKAAWKNFITDLGNSEADIQKSAQNLSDSFARVVENVTPILQNIVKAIPTAVSALTKQIPALLPAISDAFVQLVRGLLDNLSPIVSALMDVIIQIIEAVISDLPMIIGVVMELFKSVISAIVQALPELIPLLIDGIIQAIPIIINGLIEIVMAIVEALPQIITALIDALPTIIENVIQGLMSCIPQLVAGLIMLVVELVIHIPEIIVALIKAIPEIIKAVIQGFADAWPDFIAAIKELFGELVDKVMEWYDEFWSKVEKWFSDVWKSISEWFNNLIKSVGEWFAGIWKSISDWFSELFNDLGSWLSTTLSNIANWFTSLPGKVWNWMKQVGAIIGDWFAQKWDEFKNWGRNLVEGLWNGIKNAADWVKNKIAGWVDDVLGFFKGILGIHSPSAVFAGYGEFIAEGLGIGIEEGTHYATDAIEAMGDEVSESMSDVLTNIDNEVLGSSLSESVAMNQDINEAISGRAMLDSTLSVSESAEDRLNRIIDLLEMFFPLSLEKDVVLDGDELVGKLAPKMNLEFNRLSVMEARGM